MQVIYTLDTKPLLNGRWGLKNGIDILEKTIFINALSISWINQWHSDIIIHTDELGKKLLDGVAGEFEIIEDVPQDLWSLNKLNSIKNRVAPFVHIDGDFIVRMPIDFSTKTIMCDRLEIDNFHHHYTQWLSLFQSHTRDNSVKWWIPSEAWSPNCGIISIGNSAIMDSIMESVEYYKNIYLQTKGTPAQNFLEGKVDVNCVVEQFGIRRAMELQGIDIQFLTKGVNESEQRKNEIKDNYFHYYGMMKYDNVLQNALRLELKEMFPLVHKKITQNLKKWKEETK